MSMQVRVAALKQKLEQLFPGKWLNNKSKSQRYVQTGIPEMDNSVAGGVARKRITEWIGPLSSGKTSMLRSAVSYWCSRGLNVAYIDTEGKLYPADWAFVEQQWKRISETVELTQGSETAEQGAKADSPTSANKVSNCKSNRKEDNGGLLNYKKQFLPATCTADLSERGKFWIVRPPEVTSTQDENQVIPLVSKKHLQVQEAVWSADQFIRSNAFDIVILDFGAIDLNNRKSRGMGYCPPPWRIYARLQRALDRSKAALIMVSDLAEMQTTSDDVTGNQPHSNSANKQKHKAENSENSSTHNLQNSSISNNWGCHARFSFNRGAKIRGQQGLNGLSLIIPIIRFTAWRDGMSQELEVSLASSVPNRLFTHTQIPDRRSSKG